MKRPSITSFVLVLAVLGADVPTVVGQVTPSVVTGSRVRLTAPSLGLAEAVGTVQETTDEALVVQFEYPRRRETVDRSEIAAMEVSIPGTQGQRRVLKSVGVGLLVGSVSGVLVGLASGDDDPQQWFAFSAGEKAAIGGVALGLTGAAVGLIVGLVRRHEVWSPALPENLDLTVLPLVREGGAGVQVGLTLRFQ